MNNSYIKTLHFIFLGIFSLFFLMSSAIAPFPERTGTEIFKDGMAALENNEPKKAVEIWSDAWEQNTEPDYSIGFYFIKTVTANNFREYYEMASDLYYRGLESESVTDQEKELLKTDLEFMRPLLDRSEASLMEDLIENGDAEIYRHIKEFWNSVKLTVADNYNERLLEHWERCYYAEKHFKTSNRHAFDDRGEIFIKFGDPQRKREGQMLYNSGFAEYVLSTRMRSNTGGGMIGDAVDASAVYNTMSKIREYHQYPSYEVWVYTELAESSENVIYIFGNTTGSNSMNLVQSVEDFVPSAAFNTSGRNRPISFTMNNDRGLGGADLDPDDRSNIADADNSVSFASGEVISPALVMQLMYYRQLSTVDSYFSSQYDQMMERYMSTASDLGSSIAREFQHINESRIIRRQARAPDHSSSQLNKVFKVSADLYAYRFLDEDMDPYLRVYLDADPEEAVAYDELRRHNNLDLIAYDNFEIINQMRLNNRSDENLATVVDTLKLRSEQAEPDNPLNENMLTVAHPSDLHRLESNFELHNRLQYSDRSISEQSTFRNHLKGIGSSSTEIEPAMNPDGFLASDVILGYSMIDENGESSLSIAHDKQIPLNRNLTIYYEAYNLPQNDEGLYTFTLNYEIEKERSWFGRVIRFGRSGGPSITIENTEDKPRFSQLLEIVSEELDTGDYKLILTFMNSDEEVFSEREIEFTIY